jgi:hypothetical protein
MSARREGARARQRCGDGSPIPRVLLPAIAVVVALALVGCAPGQAPANLQAAPRAAAAVTSAPPLATPIYAEAPPKTPPARDDVLPMLSTVPSGTIAGFEPGAVDARARYHIEYEPFGGAPASQPSLVVVVRKAEAVGTVSRPLELEGRTLVAEVADAGAGESVTRGGRFEATLTFVERSGMVVARLKDIRALP